jgi:hypothetical protein
MSSNVERTTRRGRSLSLLETVIVLLMSCSIVIFVFTIGAKFLGRDTFDKLPDFLKDSYSAMWSAGVIAGGGFVGAVAKAFTKSERESANFTLHIVGTTTLIMVLVFATVAVSRSTEGPQFAVPMGARSIQLRKDSPKPIEFSLQNRSGGGVQARIKGEYQIKGGVLTGKVLDSELEPMFGVPTPWPPPAALNSVSIHACYLAVRNGYPVSTQEPELPMATNRQTIETMTNLRAPYRIPDFEFTFELTHLDAISPPYLCGIVEGVNWRMTFY